jgi:hypothetical protein
MGRLTWKHEGFEQILCCPGADEVCRQEAVRIQSAANGMNRFGGAGFEIHGEIVNRFGSNRCEWFVKPADDEALKACSEDHVLMMVL